MGPRDGLDTDARGKILSPLPGIERRSPGRPVRSETLHWLSYPAHQRCIIITVIVGIKDIQIDRSFSRVVEVLHTASTIGLMMEAVRISETSVNFNVTTRRYIPEDSKLHTCRREKLKSYIVYYWFYSWNPHFPNSSKKENTFDGKIFRISKNLPLIGGWETIV
jgi:hypothetical protein